MSDKQVTQKNDIAQLIQLGREQGYLTHDDITDTLPDGSTDADNFEEITQVLRDMGIKVFEDTGLSSLAKQLILGDVLENKIPDEKLFLK